MKPVRPPRPPLFYIRLGWIMLFIYYTCDAVYRALALHAAISGALGAAFVMTFVADKLLEDN